MSRVRDIWERGAAIYDQIYANNVPYHASHAVIVALLPKGRPIEVLDLGAGTGILAQRILDGIPDSRVVCLEFSPKMIEQAKRKLAPYANRVDFVCADMSDWQPERLFDAVVACNALVYKEIDIGACYTRYAGALKPGGALLNSTVVKSDDISFFGEFAQRVKPAGARPLSREVIEFSRTAGAAIAHFGDDSLAVAKTVAEHVALISAAGLIASCPWHYLSQAVLAGVKA